MVELGIITLSNIKSIGVILEVQPFASVTTAKIIVLTSMINASGLIISFIAPGSR